MDGLQQDMYVFSESGAAFRERGAGPTGILLLALLLVGVFFLSVGAYGVFSADGSMAEGELPQAILVLRELVEENEAVSVFLGFSDEETAAAMAEEDAYLLRVAEAAADYIRRHET